MPGHFVSQVSFPSYEKWFLQNGPERSRRAVWRGARGPLTAPGRSETVYEEGKEELQLDSISEAQQAKRLPVHVATIVLSETHGL
jgi:hypothetical protein